ncbi:hypothetical protein Glove_150g7 [Diversispora epigaea]|uniref:Uncharacterized protein n=1 Tax=Diversispora epigaea TaxID=1348612 RepID=A0A397IWZ6_9GLOM|nr:hypothetical protein Glove_150g7 [Diversispora epigaea]
MYRNLSEIYVILRGNLRINYGNFTFCNNYGILRLLKFPDVIHGQIIFHKNIWRLRCKILIEAEKQHGIINRMKRKPAHIIQIDSNESNNSSNCNNNSNNINNSFNNDSNNNYNNNNNNCINNSFNIIKGWVSKGIKFLEF